MARTIKQIKQEITREIMRQPVLVSALNLDTSRTFDEQVSKTNITGLVAYIVATSIWTLEKLFDTHKAEVARELEQLKPHTLRWYRNKALAFQYGYDLAEDSDTYNNSNLNDEDIKNSKIIKYAAITEADTESRLIVKIATETNGSLEPIEESQKEAFAAYINEIKDAGVRITVTNYPPDELRLNIRIFRDALVLDDTGLHRQNGTKPVEDALEEFVKELPFNGKLVLQSLANKLKQVDGVEIVQIDAAQSRWIHADSNGYGRFEPVNVTKIPISGYFKIENFNGISYVV